VLGREGVKQPVDLGLIRKAVEAEHSSRGRLVSAEGVVNLDRMVAADQDRGPQRGKVFLLGIVAGFHLQREVGVDGLEEAEAGSEVMGGEEQAVGGEVSPLVRGFEGESGRRMRHTEASCEFPRK
jgi:hypothetical protein